MSERTIGTPSQALLSLARDAWPDPTPPEQMCTNLLVILGDLARCLRSYAETGLVPADVDRELGNLVLNALRYADDLFRDVDQAVVAAAAAQRVWRETHGLEVA
jgi:hypothetical protein